MSMKAFNSQQVLTELDLKMPAVDIDKNIVEKAKKRLKKLAGRDRFRLNRIMNLLKRGA